MAFTDYRALDFSGIDKALNKLDQKRQLALLGQGIDGTPEGYTKAGQALLQLGDTNSAFKAFALRDEAAKRGLADSAVKGLADALGGGGSISAPRSPVLAPNGSGSVAPASLVQNESGGNWGAQNNEVGAGGARGHFGRLQFGQARLQEAQAAGAIPAGTTPQAFMQSPEIQQAAERWHFADIDNSIRQNGFDQLVGKAAINGVPVTVEGMRAVAHLGGKEGLRKFIETGGRYNPTDANGTSLMDYFARHGGAADLPAQGARNVAMDTGADGFAVPGQPSMSGQTFNAIMANNQPLEPSFQAEGVSQPWMGTALAPQGQRVAAGVANNRLPPPRRADLPAPGAVQTMGQMPMQPASPANAADPTRDNAGVLSGLVASEEARQGQRSGASVTNFLDNFRQAPPLSRSAAPAANVALAPSQSPADLPAPGAVQTIGTLPPAGVGALAGADAAAQPAGNATPAPRLSSDLPQPRNQQEATDFRETRAMEGRQGKVSALAAALANPNLPPNARAVGEIFLKDALEQSKAPDSVKEFMYARGMGWTTAKTPAEYAKEKQAAPTDIQEYEYAQRQGFKGSYLEFQKDKAAAKNTKTTASDKVDENTAAADKQGLQGEERKFFIANGRLPTASEKMTEGQANAALYADRMKAANEILSKPEIAAAGSSRWDRAKAGVPVVGNSWVSSEYQMADQAQRDFINAVLRRESGAAISASEFDNARAQYFPQPGDGPAVLQQKARNRQTAIDGIANAAGPTYAKRQPQNGQAPGQAPALAGGSTPQAPAAPPQGQPQGQVPQPPRPPQPGQAPVRVQSVQEALKLPSGTIFIDPNGVERQVP